MSAAKEKPQRYELTFHLESREKYTYVTDYLTEKEIASIAEDICNTCFYGKDLLLTCLPKENYPLVNQYQVIVATSFVTIHTITVHADDGELNRKRIING